MRLGGFGQDEGDGFGKVADDGVAFLEEPEGDAGAFGRPFAQAGGGDGAAGAAAGEERDGPEAVILGGLGEVGGQRLDLLRGLGGLVDGGEEGGEAFHAEGSPSVLASSSRDSPVNSVGTT